VSAADNQLDLNDAAALLAAHGRTVSTRLATVKEHYPDAHRA